LEALGIGHWALGVGHITSHEALALRWAELCNDPGLRDLPYKIELNAYGTIEVRPASTRHARLQFAVGHQLARHGDATPLPQAPEICVEVRSGSDSDAEMEMKTRAYWSAGATEVWIVAETGARAVFDAAGLQAASRYGVQLTLKSAARHARASLRRRQVVVEAVGQPFIASAVHADATAAVVLDDITEGLAACQRRRHRDGDGFCAALDLGGQLGGAGTGVTAASASSAARWQVNGEQGARVMAIPFRVNRSRCAGPPGRTTLAACPQHRRQPLGNR
jgi:Putative restriction endonuclease